MHTLTGNDAATLILSVRQQGQSMAAVMIGVDPHKGSHTAVVIDQAEMVLGEVRVRASAAQVQRLLAWAAGTGVLPVGTRGGWVDRPPWSGVRPAG